MHVHVVSIAIQERSLAINKLALFILDATYCMILAPIILTLFNCHNLARGSFIHCCVLNFLGEANTILGYMNCKILCSGLMSVNIICGLFYLPKTSADSSGGNANDQSGPRCSLKLRGKIAVLHACSS